MQSKAVCPPLPVGWLALHCASEVAQADRPHNSNAHVSSTLSVQAISSGSFRKVARALAFASILEGIGAFQHCRRILNFNSSTLPQFTAQQICYERA